MLESLRKWLDDNEPAEVSRPRAPSAVLRALPVNFLMRDLPCALERDQFLLHYQHQIDIERGTVVGAEALLRWRHPEQGLLLPETFLAALGQGPYANSVGNWVVRRALADLVRSLRLPLAPAVGSVISVNVAPHHMATADFVERTLGLIAECGVNPHQVEIELTELPLGESATLIRDHMLQLHAAGVMLALDDFGTGFSGVDRLATLPFTRVKLARELVVAAQQDARASKVVRTMVALVEDLGMTIVAEGVETVAQVDLLHNMGCYIMQGFLFDRPGPQLNLRAASFTSKAIDWLNGGGDEHDKQGTPRS